MLAPDAVTLETKCWEADWKLLLKTDRLNVLAVRNSFPFARRVLMINNVNDVARVVDYARRAVDRGWITDFVVVQDHIADALRFFQLTPESLGRGYVYSAAELVSLYSCETPFLLHFAGDCLPAQRVEWIPRALALFASDPRIKVANLTWDDNYAEARSESDEETPDFFVGFGFSDQCFLVRVSDFRAPIYGESHPASERYPEYGGELFEKRVDAWIRNCGHLRATYKFGSYRHERPGPSLWQQGRDLAARTRRRALSLLRSG